MKRNKVVGKRVADRYSITGIIGRGGMGAVYRAIPFDDPSLSVAIKVIQRSGKLGHDDLMRFQKEAALMSQLHHPNIVVFHELGLLGDDRESQAGIGAGYYIVMEVADGTNLKERIETDGRKDLAFFFQVGLQVAKALDYTHGKGIVHRDIKPHNIIVGRAFRGQRGVIVKVLDFGVAGLSEVMHFAGHRASVSPHAFEEAAGTPLYMAPEQTQLLDAPVDHRVDLYSLGCVLYEVLTGKPPFTANSREKLEKQHVFAELEPLTNLRPDVPPLIEKIVHKLLEKHPDRRYQTAFALQADLMRAKSLHESSGGFSGVNFPLGLKDQFQAVSAKLKLVGRDEELRSLIAGYDAVAMPKGRSRLALIKGDAGVGKSRLRAEFQTYLTRRRVKFISGSFSQHENALPFNALANAFNQYLLRVLRSHPHEASELRGRLRTTIGPMTNMIAEIVPGLRPYIDPQSPEEQTEVEEYQDILTDPETFKKFAKAFSDFTRCLGTDNQPVVFLFDDLHWADEKSLDLIDEFFTNANTQQFYLIVTQRNDPSFSNERCERFVAKFRKLRRRFQEIALGPVSKPAVREIVNNMLASPESIGDSFVEYLYRESAGNPMHLVELTRTLVANDYVYPKNRDGDWGYDVDSLKETSVKLQTVDLILNRIQDFQEFDAQVLEVAATVGVTFQFEVLLVEGADQSVPVMRAIQRAVDEGLFVRISDDEDLRHLGKTFMFVHKKARDAIYGSIELRRRRGIHKKLARKLESAVEAPTPKVLFALAHHFNLARDREEDGSDFELDKSALRANLRAGRAAMASDSWHTAERYFENALAISGFWGKKICSRTEYAALQETLADVAALQRNYGKAIRSYRDLLTGPLPPDMRASVAIKALRYQSISGVVTESRSLLRSSLVELGKARSLESWLQPALSWLSLARDAWPLGAGRIMAVLKSAYVLRGKPSQARQYPAIQLFRVGSTLYRTDRPDRALVFHDHAFQQALQGLGDVEQLIKTAADRAALLGYFGRSRAAYRYLDISMDVARKCGQRSAYGYVAMLRLLTIDYIRDRQEEISDHLRLATKYLDVDKDREDCGLILTFKIFRELRRGNFATVNRYTQLMPDTLPTRNQMSPRAVAMMLFGYLLQGSRANIVRHGEMFIKRRRFVAAREDDLYVGVIQTLISFARGDTNKARQSFIDVVCRLSGRNVNGERLHRIEFLFPFEHDFIMIFAFVFPEIFAQEYGRRLMRDSEMKAVLSLLKYRVKSMKGSERSIPLLINARLRDLTGDRARIREMYDRALKGAKISGNNLVQILAYQWFGVHLMDKGNQQRRDYVKRALQLAKKLNMKAIADCAQNELERRGVRVSTPSKVTSSGTPEGPKTRLPVAHLQLMSADDYSDRDLTGKLDKTLSLLGRYYHTTNTSVILASETHSAPRVVHSSNPDLHMEDLINYISPYFNIRSTLYLPLHDAPWVKNRDETSAEGLPRGSTHPPDSLSAVSAISEAGPEEIEEIMEASAIDETIVVENTESKQEATDVTAVNARPEEEATRKSDHRAQKTLDRGGHGNKARAGLEMSALIPLRTDFQSVGVVFCEGMRSLQGQDKADSRHELDQLGAQLALALEPGEHSTSAIATESDRKRAYRSASVTLEKNSWLRMWSEGRLRAQRETTWYLGLNLGPRQYLLTYCTLTGDSAIRQRLGSMVWHQIYVMRALYAATGRECLAIDEVRDELMALLGADSGAKRLDAISLAFSIIDRDQQFSVSGHFGPSRPIVVGAENIVTPYNDVVLKLSSGRDLRYWEVSADLTAAHCYLASYDTVRLDDIPLDNVERSFASRITAATSDADMDRLLTRLVGRENLPRYYVAATMHGEGAERNETATGDEFGEDLGDTKAS